MAGPWDKYKAAPSEESGPWVKYRKPVQENPEASIAPSPTADAQPEPKDGFLKGAASGAMETVKNLGRVVPALETGAQVATSMYGLPLSGLAGLLALPFGADKASGVIKKVQDLTMYQPQTEGGKQLSGAVNAPFELLSKAGGAAGEKTLEMTGSPTAAAAVGTAIEASPLLLGLRKPGKPIAEKVSSAVDTGIQKGIRPSVAGKPTASSRKFYSKKAESAVLDIVKNKENLEYIDAAGNRAKGRLPQTVDEFGQVIEQRKRDVFEKYDSLKDQAEAGGASIDLSPVAAQLDTIINDTSIRLTSPETIAYAQARKAALEKEGGVSLTDAQNSIKILNESLNAYYDNRSIQNKGKAVVDELIANNLRKAQDAAIESVTAGGYQGLKNQYGSFKQIEKAVNHRAIVHGRKSPKGFFDIGDVFSGFHAIKAIMSKDPVGIAASAGSKAIIERMKLKSNPDRIIRDMFKDVEGALGSSPKSNAPGVAAMAGISSQAGMEDE